MCQNDVPKQISCLSYSNQFIKSNRRSGKEGQSFSYGLGKICSTQVYSIHCLSIIFKRIRNMVVVTPVYIRKTMTSPYQKIKKIDDTFNDAVLALSNFKAGMYNLILLDVKMPQINGFELCEKIR
jgi:hypothetical protein